MRFFTLLLSVALLVIAPVSFAGKVAVLNIEQAVLSTEAAKKAEKALQGKSEYAALVAKVEGLKADFEALDKEAKTQSETWTAEKKQETQKKGKKLSEDYQAAMQKVQAEQQAVVGKLMQEMQPKLKAVIDEIVAAEGIDIIVKSQAAFYATPAVDITSKVADRLNKSAKPAAASEKPEKTDKAK